jgi:hypothetical protein
VFAELALAGMRTASGSCCIYTAKVRVAVDMWAMQGSSYRGRRRIGVADKLRHWLVGVEATHDQAGERLKLSRLEDNLVGLSKHRKNKFAETAMVP